MAKYRITKNSRGKFFPEVKSIGTMWSWSPFYEIDKDDFEYTVSFDTLGEAEKYIEKELERKKKVTWSVVKEYQ